MIVKDRTLYVKVLEAKNVFPEKTKHADSYCSVVVEGGEQRRTPTVYHDTNPFFGEELVFSDQLPSDMCRISIGLWQDLKQTGVPDKPHGQIMFPRDMLEDGRFEDEQWYSLAHNDNTIAAVGEIKLGMKLSGGNGGPNTLTVAVDEARNFSDGAKGPRDIYIVLHILPDPQALSTKRTRCLRGSTNKAFDLDIVMPLSSNYRTEELHVSLWDVRPGEPCLGHVSIPMDTLEHNEEITSRWRGLLPPPASFAKDLTSKEKGLPEAEIVEARAKAFLRTMQSTTKEYSRKKHPHKLVDFKFGLTVSFCGHCGLALSPQRTHLQCSVCKVSSHLPCSKLIANNCGHVAAVRVKIKYSASIILPLETYRPFLDLLSQDDYHLAHLFGRVSKDREEAAWPLIKLMEADNSTQEFLLAIIQAEINDTNDPNTLFRGNSMASKAVDVYMRYLGKGYLKSTLGDIIKMIVSKRLHCELDPLKLDRGEDLERNRRSLADLNQRVMNAIYDNRFALPTQWRPLFAHVQAEVTKKFPKEPSVRYTAVSGFIFLRFFAPAILGPKLFDLADEYIDPKTSRTLTLLAKTLQTLANLVPFGEKEPYMKEMNPFIQANIEKMQSYINGIAARELVTSKAPSLHHVRYETAREAARLFNLYVRAAPTIIQSMTEEDAPIVRRLARVLTKLTIKTTATDGIDFNPFSFPTLKQSYANLLNMRLETRPVRAQLQEVSSPMLSRSSTVPQTLTDMLQDAVDSPEFATSVKPGDGSHDPAAAKPLSFSSRFEPLFSDVGAELLDIVNTAPQLPGSYAAETAEGVDSSMPPASGSESTVNITSSRAETPPASLPGSARSSVRSRFTPAASAIAAQDAPPISAISATPMLQQKEEPSIPSPKLAAASPAKPAAQPALSLTVPQPPSASPSDVSPRTAGEGRQPEPARQQPAAGVARIPQILTPIATSMMAWTSKDYEAEVAPASAGPQTAAPPTPGTASDASPQTSTPVTPAQSTRRLPRQGARLVGTPNSHTQNQTRLDALAIMALLNSARESAVDQAESSLAAHGECAACGKTVVGAEHRKVGEQVWHAHHFACSVCQAVIGAVKDAEVHNGIIYCAQHKLKKCATCALVIDDNTSALCALGQAYHAACFVCRACQCPLVDGFAVFEDMPLCEEDYFRAAGLICGGCGERITKEYVQIGGRKFHIDCKRCEKCHETLGNKSYFILEESVFCSAHKEMLTCAACGNLVTDGAAAGQIMRLSNGRTFHPQHFRCAGCQTDLCHAGFYETNNTAKCENCYLSSFG
ncbi:hypothetical protein HDU87_005200 [Geranomyces variabilis]|uniref:Uncharacterized protein n=1 Tax=Geranomyces variabilis TaxID=109894 RepID=A0AAD5TMT4_9FUNG|nr:hypothetical protein HDU87_005200 [Geranomyces variabilis]